MMKTVKHTLHTIGDRGGDFARTVGSETTDLAKRFGHETSRFAKRVGPRRGLIALAVLAAAIGGSVALSRYLRARKLRDLRERNETGADTSAGRPTKSDTRSPAQRPANVYSH
jgi:hypothetical protein